MPLSNVPSCNSKSGSVSEMKVTFLEDKELMRKFDSAWKAKGSKTRTAAFHQFIVDTIRADEKEKNKV